jgi:addiction module HigA family antidote
MTKQLLPLVNPGEILREEFLAPLGMSANQLAQALRVPANRITGILNGTRGITSETALRLSRYFGTSAELWLNLQTDYDLRQARREFAERIEREVRPRNAA